MTTFEDEYTSLSAMSDEELREELRRIRKARRAPKKKTPAPKKSKKPKALKVSKDISAEDAANILKQLGVSE